MRVEFLPVSLILVISTCYIHCRIFFFFNNFITVKMASVRKLSVENNEICEEIFADDLSDVGSDNA